MKRSVRPNQIQHLLLTAKNERYSNLYVNYENFEEIPREVLEINSIQGLFLKRNLLKSLVSCRLVGEKIDYTATSSHVLYIQTLPWKRQCFEDYLLYS